MPFGKYKDFAACVADNRDKKNPEAYCATIHHEITGQWPGEMAAGASRRAARKHGGKKR